MPYESPKRQKHRQMIPPTPEDIAAHIRALNGLLEKRAAPQLAPADELVLFLDSRGIRGSEYERIDEALRKRSRHSAGNSFYLGGHRDGLAIAHEGDATQIQIDGQVIAVIGQNEAGNLRTAANRPNSTRALGTT
jgi:hypothetical protein